MSDQRSIALTASLASLLWLTSCTARTEIALRPNIVLVCLDTVRADHLEIYGYDRATTPTLLQLASTGTVFEDVLSTSNWTVPAVASIFTGLPALLHGAGVHGDVRQQRESEPPSQYSADLPTLSKHLAAAGYRTGLFSANPFLYGNFKVGFETSQVDWVDARKLAAEALAWLRLEDSRPAFVYIQFMDAHQPNRPPEPYFQMFPSGDGQPHEPRHGDWNFGQVEDLQNADFRAFREHRIAVYDGSIRYIDSELGSLFSALNEQPFAGKTITVVTADHGEEFWDHAIEQAALRDDPRGIWGVGHGHTMYQELLRVPLVVSGPGVSRGVRDPCPASLLDLVPTITALAGAPEFPVAHGENLVSRLRKSTDECRPRVRVASSPAYGPNGLALFSGDWKLIEHFHRKAQVFNLANDPSERRDLAQVVEGQLRALRKQLRRIQSFESAAAGVAPNEQEGLVEDLRALGYL